MLGAASRNHLVASRRHSPTLAWTLRCLPYPGPISTVSCRTNWRSAWSEGFRGTFHVQGRAANSRSSLVITPDRELIANSAICGRNARLPGDLDDDRCGVDFGSSREPLHV